MVSSRLSHERAMLHRAADAAMECLPPLLLLDADAAQRSRHDHRHAVRMNLLAACGADDLGAVRVHHL